MLTADLITPRLRCTSTTLTIELLDEQDPQWQRIAGELIALLQSKVGCSFASWTQALEAYIGDSLNYVVMRGLAKVLSDAATFTSPATGVSPTVIRERLFAYGPVFEARDVFHTQTHQEVVQSAAAELGLSAEQVEAALFADRPSHTILTDAGPPWTPADLLARYNLELTRGVLYWASQLRIDVAGNYKDLWKSRTQTSSVQHNNTVEDTSVYKDLWRYIKLFKLMFWAQPLAGGGYHIELDGPISPFVHNTTRYGRQFAAFLPALLLCEQWRLVAEVHPPVSFTPLTYHLDSTSSLRSHFKRSGVFDSRLEADFAAEFEAKVGSKRGHWQLVRESEVLLLGDTVMIPDFLLVDEQDETRKILIELVGFWHPNYLRRKIEKVRAANCEHLLLLVYKGLKVTEEAFQDSVSEVIFFQHKPVLKEVMETVEAMAERIYGPRPKREKKQKAKKPRTPKKSKKQA